MTANTHRGEVSVELGEHGEVLCRPTFQALAAIEADLKEPIIPIAQRAVALSVGVTDATVIVFHTQRAAGGKLTRQQVGEAVMRAGLINVALKVNEMLQLALTAEDPNSAAATAEATQAETPASTGAAS